MKKEKAKGSSVWKEGSSIGRGPKSTLALAAVVIGLVVYGLVQVARGNLGWAAGLVMASFVIGAALSVAIVNGPRLLREQRASWASKIEGVAFEGREIHVEQEDGAMWACAISVGAAMKEGPEWLAPFKRAPLGCVREGPGRLWVSREGWEWRMERDRDMTLRRAMARVEADGFKVFERANQKQAEHEAMLGLVKGREALAKSELDARDAARAAQRAAAREAGFRRDDQG